MKVTVSELGMQKRMRMPEFYFLVPFLIDQGAHVRCGEQCLNVLHFTLPYNCSYFTHFAQWRAGTGNACDSGLLALSCAYKLGREGLTNEAKLKKNVPLNTFPVTPVLSRGLWPADYTYSVSF